MDPMLMTGAGHIDAERAFMRARRSRRRAALGRWLRRERGGQLPVSDPRAFRSAPPHVRREVREIPLAQIRSTVEPSKSALFDCAFRPGGLAQRRWQRIWLAEQRGTALPPIAVVAVGDSYAIRDGHHRVSVARARGALAIDATVERTALGA
jgi:hypothetical protein